MIYQSDPTVTAWEDRLEDNPSLWAEVESDPVLEARILDYTTNYPVY